jgi:hypothetical protein
MTDTDPLAPYLQSRRDFEELESKTYNELTQLLLDVESQVHFADSLNGSVDPTIRNIIRQDARRIRAELARRRENEKKEPDKDEGSFWPEPLSYKAFKDRPIDPTRWLLADAIPVNAASLLVAPARTGKTRFALNLGLAISRGADFLNRKTVKSPVFYVCIDNSADELRDFTDALGFQDEDQMLIHTGQIPGDATGWLMDMIKKFSVKIAIVDTLQRFFHIDDINDSSKVVAAMDPLDLEIKKIGCHAMYLHHANRRGNENYLDAALGSNSLKGMCPYYFHLGRMGETQQRILSTDFRSGKNFERVSIKIDSKTGWAYVAGTYEDAIVDDTTPQVIQFLELEPEATEPTIRKNISARGIFVSKALRELYKTGRVERQGKGRKGDPFRYTLAALLDSSSSYSYKRESISGLESKKDSQGAVNQQEILVPQHPDKNGTSTDLNGLASDALSIFGGGKVIKRATGQ